MRVVFIEKETVAEAWANAVLDVFFFGEKIKTEYDGPHDFPSRDATVLIHVKDPFSNALRGYKTPIYAHMGDLYATESVKGGYIEEIVEGIHDSKIGKTKSFPYTYHDRITNYRWKSSENGLLPDELDPPIKQIQYIVKKLKQNGYSRRAQAITWRPHIDPGSEDPPCLQRLWARVINNLLVFETTWRSRDLFKAWGANVNGMLAWAKMIADNLDLKVGSYIDFSNSLHIYGKKKVTIEVVEFIDRLMKRERNKYDTKYFEAFQQLQTTTFYDLYFKRLELKKQAIKLDKTDIKTKTKIGKEIDELNNKIKMLKDY
ncbi:MAG: thymidylate synthase [Promethearchaeota archaeon]